jgi:sulfoxide reductase heme-binding subunit YedZ
MPSWLNPSRAQLRWLIKPGVFLLSLYPAAILLGRTFEIIEPGLGANPIEAIQDYLGIWGLRFLLLTLAITPLHWLMGLAWPLQLRRMLGLYTFFYCSIHFLVWLILDQGLAVGPILEDILERPFITIGASALLLMLPLAITSTHGWRRQLGRRWNKLHWLIYLIGILMCWHFFWQVKKDLLEPLVYCSILAALLLVRIFKRIRKRSAVSQANTNPA